MAGNSSLGRASLTLTTNNAGLDKGLGQAHASINNFKNRVSSQLGKVNVGSAVDQIGGNFRGAMGKISGGTGGILGNLGGALAGGFTRAGAALGRLGPIGMVAAAAVVAIGVGAAGTLKILSSVTNQIEQLAVVGKQARSLGIASDQFMGLSAAAKKAGIEGDQFGTILQKAQAKIAGGSPEVQAALTKMGMTFADLKGQSPDQQFYAIARGLGTVGDAGDKAFIATKLFEEQGLKLLPMLGQGEAKLRAFVDQQKKIGGALDDRQMGRIMKAKEAMPNFSSYFNGTWNKITAGLAPVIEAVGKGLQRVLDRAAPLFDWFSRAAETVGDILGPAFTELVEVSFEFFEAVGRGAGILFGIGEEFPTVGEVIKKTFKAIAMTGAYAWDTLKAGAGGLVIVSSYVVDGFNLVVGVFKEITDLAKDIPGAPDWVKNLAAGTERFEANVAGAAEKMRGWGQGAIDGFGKSGQKVEAWFDKLGKKQEENLVRPLVAAEQMVEASMKKFDTAFAERGSKEEYQARIRFEMGAQDKQEAQARKETNRLLGKQVGELQKLGGKVGTILGIL